MTNLEFLFNAITNAPFWAWCSIILMLLGAGMVLGVMLWDRHDYIKRLREYDLEGRLKG